jgi:RNA polymerase sigma-70 factor (ECF subfamily)
MGVLVGNAEAEGLPLYADNVMRKLMDKQASGAVRSAVDSDDETLLMCLQASDMEALGVLFQRYAGLMLSIARRVLRDNDEAEDLVQDVFLFLFLKSKSFDPAKGSARAWLMQVTFHRAYDRRRYLCARSFYDRALSEQAAEELPSPVNPAIDNAEDFFCWQSCLEPAFEGLSDDQRKTLMLYFYDGYTIHEISEKLGQSFGNVQHHFYRGLDRLRKLVFHKNGERFDRGESDGGNSKPLSAQVSPGKRSVG